MAVRRPTARTTTSNQVTVTVDDCTFCLTNLDTIFGTLVGDQVFKTELYTLARRLAKQAVKKNITSFDDRYLKVIRVNSIWYQLQSLSYPSNNLLLPDFRATETYKRIEKIYSKKSA